MRAASVLDLWSHSALQSFEVAQRTRARATGATPSHLFCALAAGFALLATECRFPEYEFAGVGSGGTAGSSAAAGAAGAADGTSCNDGELNGSESDLDCGGDCARKCDDGELCQVGEQDCKNRVCGNDGRCLAAACNDDLQNGDETALDCGGSCTAKCAVGSGCELGDRDCESGVCDGAGSCAEPTCNDGVKNGDEVDVDCAGSSCGLCGPLAACTLPDSCASGLCSNGACDSGLHVYYVAATTDDGVAAKPNIRLINEGQDTFAFSDLELRYYMTVAGEGTLPLLFDDISASVIDSANIDQYVFFEFVPITAAEGYISITFAAGAAELFPDDVLELSVSISFETDSSLVQGNDYSFDALASQANLYDRIPVYIAGSRVAGSEP